MFGRYRRFRNPLVFWRRRASVSRVPAIQRPPYRLDFLEPGQLRLELRRMLTVARRHRRRSSVYA
jgi:hypothetical protein